MIGLQAAAIAAFKEKSMKNRLTGFGFLLAGSVNIAGILLFSKLFTNDLMQSLDPAVFSNVGIASIILWGMAYLSVRDRFQAAPQIVGVFMVEKFFYAAVWGQWIFHHWKDLGNVYQEDLITGLFFSVYGLNDFLFGVFFLIVFISCTRKGESDDPVVRI